LGIPHQSDQISAEASGRDRRHWATDP
jgi:hypothetical protein